MRKTIKIFTILSFLLPSIFCFVGCEGLGDKIEIYYNEKDANKDFPNNDNTITPSQNSIVTKIGLFIITPSKNSLSAIGILVVPYAFPKSRLLILFPFLISIIVFFENISFFIKKHILKFYIFSSICLLVFIFYTFFILDATLKYGIFFTLFFNIIGCVFYLKSNRTIVVE